MNAPFKMPVTSKAERELAAKLNARRLIKALQDYEHNIGFRDEDYWFLRATDCASLVWRDYDSFGEAMQALCHELRIDAEGYELNDDGDRAINAERVFVPQVSS